jgi:hypothetical protein
LSLDACLTLIASGGGLVHSQQDADGVGVPLDVRPDLDRNTRRDGILPQRR